MEIAFSNLARAPAIKSRQNPTRTFFRNITRKPALFAASCLMVATFSSTMPLTSCTACTEARKRADAEDARTMAQYSGSDEATQSAVRRRIWWNRNGWGLGLFGFGTFVLSINFFSGRVNSGSRKTNDTNDGMSQLHKQRFDGARQDIVFKGETPHY